MRVLQKRITMTQSNELTENKTHFAIAGVAFLFCLVWAVVGESDMKIVAVSISFMYFLKSGIDMEMSARALEAH